MEDFDYELPEAAIAQVPVEPRDSARLLDATEASGAVRHRRVRDLPAVVGPGDVVVLNETMVMAARLELAKATGGRVEVLLLDQGPEDWWTALVRPGRRVPAGTRLYLGPEPVAVVGEAIGQGRRRVRLDAPDLAARVGRVPLPPYIHAPLADPGRYQTVYARRPGSAAAPTAGLHLTREVLEACVGAGAEVVTLDLSVGLDTFRPLSGPRLQDHVMHSERYSVPASTMQAVYRARRVLAVGTTTVRALETACATGRLEGRTDLFITPGFRFGVVDLMLTNFHLPRSTLLVLLEAFCGPRWRDLYALALGVGYRFLSFGDAMLVARADPSQRRGRHGLEETAP